MVTNVLRVQQEVIDQKEHLNEIVQKFWNLESVGVSKDDKCLMTEEHKCLMENQIVDMRWDKSEDNFIFDFNEIR